MAKVTFLQGKARGKVGGIVYRTIAGIGTVASEYNPSPANPRTIAQVEQRNKMNLAGRISKITPYAAIAGLGGSRRAARALFVSNILKAASNDTVGENTAYVLAAKLQFSEGVETFLGVTGVMEDASNELTLTFDTSAVSQTLLGGLVIAYFPDSETGISCKVQKVDSFDAPLQMTFPHPMDAGMQLAVFVVPFVDKGDASRVAYGELSLDRNGFDVQYVRTLLASNSYAKSVSNIVVVLEA